MKDDTYAFRRIGGGLRRPLLCLQHFTGTTRRFEALRGRHPNVAFAVFETAGDRVAGEAAVGPEPVDEAELGSMIGTTSDLQFSDLDPNPKAPNMLSYTGIAVVSCGPGTSWCRDRRFGRLTMFERPGVGVFNDETFLTGNVGSGVKCYAPNNRWGLRGDYPFDASQSKDDAPIFFGRDTRYAHRVTAP